MNCSEFVNHAHNSMNKKYIIGGIVIIALIALVIFGPKSNPVNSDKVKVATSFYPLYFFTSEIGQDNINVVNITPAGAEPHDYEPTAKDIANISDSKLLVLNGGGLEAWGQNILQNIDQNNTTVVVAGVALATQHITEEGKTIQDPHVWLSPPLAKQMADRITVGLETADPANKNLYELGNTALKLKLDILDAKYKAGLASCAKKDIVTSHAAFGYLAAAYGLNQVSITGISPDSEPSSQQLAQVSEFVKKNHIKYIFFESLVSPKLSETIATETGAKTLELNPIEGLSNEEISKGENYITVMERNLTNLKIALECK